MPEQMVVVTGAWSWPSEICVTTLHWADAEAARERARATMLARILAVLSEGVIGWLAAAREMRGCVCFFQNVSGECDEFVCLVLTRVGLIWSERV